MQWPKDPWSNYGITLVFTVVTVIVTVTMRHMVMTVNLMSCAARREFLGL